MRAYERLLRYVVIHTSSSEKTEMTPSTERQRDLSDELAKEMEQIGFVNVEVDEHAYVYGTIPADPGLEKKPCIALISHLDTIPDDDFPGMNVKPVLVPDYDGSDLSLGESGRVLSPAAFPDLLRKKGHTLITTDGTTVLGADDKAGIAEILTACETLLERTLPHGRIEVCFTPDEENGHGAQLLSLERLNADFAFTVDGGAVDEINLETFNASAAEVCFNGVNVHPGEAKGKMVNALLAAMEFNAMLPAGDIPAETENREGFFHLIRMNGDVEKAELSYLIRDHDENMLEFRKKAMEHAAKILNERYGENTVLLTVKDQYRNMAEVLCKLPEVAERADAAVRSAGLEPKHIPVRGGTDGSQLSFRGLPCPNLGTGGEGFHGPYEHISAEDMDTMTEILVSLLRV